MGFRIGSERAGHWRRPIRAIGTAAQSAFPSTNVLEPQHPYRQARTSSTLATTSYFGVDLGATGTVTAVIVGNVNVASVQVQAHSLDTWTSPTHTSGAQAVSQDPLTGRHNLVYVPGSAWTTSNRYVRVVANTTTSTDSTGVFAVGYIVVLASFPELATPLADPIDAVPVEPIITADGYGGADHTIAVGETRAEITIAQSLAPASADSEILTLLRREGEAGQFVFYMNDGDTSQVYVVRRRGRAGLTYVGPNARRVAGITLREQV